MHLEKLAKEFEAFQLEKGENFPTFDPHVNFMTHLCSIHCLGFVGNSISIKDSIDENETKVEVSSNVPKEVEGITKHNAMSTSPQHSNRSRGSVQNLSSQRMSQKREHTLQQNRPLAPKLALDFSVI